MKPATVTLIAAVLMAAVGGSGCGNSGSSPFLFPTEKSTITISSQDRFAAGPTTTTYSGDGTTMRSFVTADAIMISAFSGDAIGSWMFSAFTNGASAGTYTILDNGRFSYFHMDEFTADALSGGTITITDTGTGSGTHVKGSFDSVVEINSASTNTMRMWGTFSIERGT